MCGIPDILYVDHGSDFTSSHLAQASHDLRMQIVYSTVARPQGRGKIERFFRTLSTQLLAELPGYLHPARGRKLPEPVLDIGELDDRIRQFIHEYNTRTHPSAPQGAATDLLATLVASTRRWFLYFTLNTASPCGKNPPVWHGL